MQANMIVERATDDRPAFYECGICGCCHPIAWDGDCRENENRFAADQLDARHGPHGWQELPMPTWDD